MTEEVKAQIASIAGIPNTAGWQIVDVDEENQLYKIHHKSPDEADVSKYGGIRGLIIDLKAEIVIFKSFAYTPTAVCDSLEIKTDNGLTKLVIEDDQNCIHDLNFDNVEIRTGFEGTLVHVFKLKGKVYHTTRKRFDISRSRWGNSASFGEIYRQLNGPGDFELFDDDCDTSPWCYSFIMVHPDVLVSSKTPVGSGFLVYLGATKMWDTDYDKCPYKQIDHDGTYLRANYESDPRPCAGRVQDEPWEPENLTPNLGLAVTNSDFIYYPSNISLDHANQYLRFGVHMPFLDAKLDSRLYPGEFVILHITDEDGSKRLLRVESTSYAWRSELRDNKPNLKQQFYCLADLARKSPGDKKYFHRYLGRYPKLTPHKNVDILQWVEHAPMLVWPQNKIHPRYLSDRDSRLKNIWLSFLMSVPLHRQPEVSKFLKEYETRRTEIIRWLREIEKIPDLSAYDEPKFNRAKDIIRETRSYARVLAQQGRNLDSRGHVRSHKQQVNINIRNLILKENGASLYRLGKAMDLWYQPHDEEQ